MLLPHAVMVEGHVVAALPTGEEPTVDVRRHG